MQQLLGLMLASLITAWAMGNYLPRLAKLDNQQFDNGTATQFAEFANAAARYLASQQNVFRQALSNDSLFFPRSFTAADLVAGGHLSPRFVDLNTFGQSHAVIVRALLVGNTTYFEGLAITHGGEDIPEVESGRLALLAGPRAGRIHASDPALAVGASGQWRMEHSILTGRNVGLGHAPAVGHLAGYISTLEFAGAAEPSLTAAGIFPAGALISKPACDRGIAEIYVVPVQFSDNARGHALRGVLAFAEEHPDGKAWFARLRVYVESELPPGVVPGQAGSEPSIPLSTAIAPSPSHGRVAVFLSCS